MIEEFAALPDDDQLAFLQLEAEFREEFENKTSDNSSNWQFEASDYMNKTLAAANALGLDQFSNYYALKYNDSDFGDEFWAFMRAVDTLKIQIRVQGARRQKGNSVGLTDEQKTKIHALIEKIRQAVTASTADVVKKERLYDILARLGKEVSKPRTAMARFGDLARGLAGISKDVAEEGAEPWWKWAKLIFGEVDEAKGRDPQLPKPEELKKIEPPRKELPKPKDEGADDELPF
ncbi:hypothetical protein GYB14_19170 [bacterium]|nr:hypothetical protein [bacterium]